MERRFGMEGGGQLSVTEEGAYVVLEARRPADEQGLYKVWLVGERGGQMQLGTLAPEQGELRLRRRISRGQLEQAGCWPVGKVQVRMAFAFAQKRAWYCEGRPGLRVEDELLRRLLRRPMLCRDTRDGFQLAAPFAADGPVTLNTLLCLARVERVEGRPHLIWSFDRKGRPRLAGSSRQHGDGPAGDAC